MEDYGDYPVRQQAFLSMLRDQLSMFDAASLALDNKLIGLVGLSSLSVALVTLALSRIAPPSAPAPVTFLILAAFIALILMVLLALSAWFAQDYSVPGPENTESDYIFKEYLEPDTVTALNRMIAAYQAAEIDLCAATIRKGGTLNWCLILYVVQLLFLAAAVGTSFAPVR